jgi:hypothetical protein
MLSMPPLLLFLHRPLQPSHLPLLLQVLLLLRQPQEGEYSIFVCLMTAWFCLWLV